MNLRFSKQRDVWFLFTLLTLIAVAYSAERLHHHHQSHQELAVSALQDFRQILELQQKRNADLLHSLASDIYDLGRHDSLLLNQLHGVSKLTRVVFQDITAIPSKPEPYSLYMNSMLTYFSDVTSIVGDSREISKLSQDTEQLLQQMADENGEMSIRVFLISLQTNILKTEQLALTLLGKRITPKGNYYVY